MLQQLVTTTFNIGPNFGCEALDQLRDLCPWLSHTESLLYKRLSLTSHNHSSQVQVQVHNT